MAAPTPASPDTLISLKVNHDGYVKKLKLPLRDLGASDLEDKLRAILPIAQGTNTLIERYSDSLATYVTLTPENTSAYKQLYRAAKAKSKLKLRVTTQEEAPAAQEESDSSHTPTDDSQGEAEARKVVPKPVTLEDVPEDAKSGPRYPDLMVPPKLREQLSFPSAIPHESAEFARLKAATARPGMTRPVIQPTSSIRSLPVRLSDPGRLTNPAYHPSFGPPPPLHTAEMAKPAPRESLMTIPMITDPPCQNNVPRTGYAVCCNSCDETIPEAHYHCSSCDDGDFDLCIDCVEKGITCRDASHWLIKRVVKNGVIINSTTERITPKPKPKTNSATAAAIDWFEEMAKPKPSNVETIDKLNSSNASSVAQVAPSISHLLYQSDVVRTCNNCISEMAEEEFVHCTSCYDFDLCKACFEKDQHGHHPKHAFVPAVAGTTFSASISKRLPAGRDRVHNAICDSCDSYITGVRYKCLDCPDWDYCSQCHEDAGFIHPNHRFVPLYEPIQETSNARLPGKPTHFGICCDGPLCNISSKARSTYIVGDRYKCAVCHDTDFCASCEACPSNTHNKTHPLIKFKTPVRGCSVSTHGEHLNGKPMRVMGDRVRDEATSSVATETSVTDQGIAIDSVRTVVDVKPSEPEPEPKAEVEKPVEDVKPEPSPEDLVAVFVEDAIADGTGLAPNRMFEQTWTLRNEGTVSWPAGTRIKFVGGDFMGLVDHLHPVGTKELLAASESGPCARDIDPGETCTFHVPLRSPSQLGKRTSYWRLTTPDGFRFGDRLWCHIVVQSQIPMANATPLAPAKEETPVKEEVQEATPEVTREVAPAKPEESSQMIFPKLEKESPIASMYEEAAPNSVAADVDVNEEIDDFEEDDEWAEDDSADGFMTDEEYDILDASDEEYLEDQQKKLLKK